MRRTDGIKVERHYSILASAGHARLAGTQDHLSNQESRNSENSLFAFIPLFLFPDSGAPFNCLFLVHGFQIHLSFQIQSVFIRVISG